MSDDPLTLLSAAPAPPMTVDPYAAMATARRNRARRRVVTALAAVAAVVALAFGGWVVTGVGNTTRSQPAPRWRRRPCSRSGPPPRRWCRSRRSR